MPAAQARPALWDEVDADEAAFYTSVLATLNERGLPHLVGGAYAFAHFTGMRRHTKDLDLFIRRGDYEAIAAALGEAGYRTELTFPHWLAKVHCGAAFVDLIFNSGNGVSPVDDEWFEHAAAAEVLGVPARIVPAEEMIWTKAFIMERERFDGADVAHLLRACAGSLDWRRLLQRFGPHWRVLLSHLVLFGFIYPGQQALIPAWLQSELLERLRDEDRLPPRPAAPVRAARLLSREQYLHDVEQQGYRDARFTPASTMAAKDVARWTQAIADRDGAPQDGL